MTWPSSGSSRRESINAARPGIRTGWDRTIWPSRWNKSEKPRDGRIPVHIKLPACRVSDDVKLAAKCGADAIVLDGMQAGTGTSGKILLDHSGIPTMAAIPAAREALQEIGSTARSP